MYILEFARFGHAHVMYPRITQASSSLTLEYAFLTMLQGADTDGRRADEDGADDKADWISAGANEKEAVVRHKHHYVHLV